MRKKGFRISRLRKRRLENEECEEDNDDRFSFKDFEFFAEEALAGTHLEKMLTESLALSSKRNVKDYIS